MHLRTLVRRRWAAWSLIVALLALPGLGGCPRAEEPEGDVNGDGVLDQGDLDEVTALFGTSTGDTNFDPAADLDGDGTIGLADLQILTRLLDEQQAGG